jgi:hypothetical protein
MAKPCSTGAKFLDVLTTALDKPLEHGGGMLNILRTGVQIIVALADAFYEVAIDKEAARPCSASASADATKTLGS